MSCWILFRLSGLIKLGNADAIGCGLLIPECIQLVHGLRTMSLLRLLEQNKCSGINGFRKPPGRGGGGGSARYHPTGSRYVRHTTGLLRSCPLQAERRPLGERRYVLLDALWRGFGEVFIGVFDCWLEPIWRRTRLVDSPRELFHTMTFTTSTFVCYNMVLAITMFALFSSLHTPSLQQKCAKWSRLGKGWTRKWLRSLVASTER